MKEEEKKDRNDKPSGRDYFMERMRKKNPDYAPSDDEQFLSDLRDDYAGDEEELNQYRDTNSKLSDLIEKDPRFGALLSEMSDGKSSEYAIGKLYGRDFLDLDEKGYEELERGYAEHLAQLEKEKSEREEVFRNVERYKGRLQKYASENVLSQEDAERLNDAIAKDAENFLSGIIDESYIDYKWKGMNFESAVKDAAEAGVAEGRNQKIDARMKKAGNIPDLGKSYGGEKSKAPETRKSFYDGL